MTEYTYNLGKLSDGAGEVIITLLSSEDEYNAETNELAFKVSFFKPSGKWYVEEFFSVSGTKLADCSTEELWSAENSVARYELYNKVIDFFRTGELYNGMFAVIDYPAFYPTLLKADNRTGKFSKSC